MIRSVFCVLMLGPLQNAIAAVCWTDADLALLEKTQTNSVIYVWSPRMALSVLHANEVAQQANAAGLTFVPIVDGRVSESEWRAALQVASDASGLPSRLSVSQSACASRLITLDAYQHFPGVFLVRSGELQAQKWTGAMNSGHWAAAFNAELKSSIPTALLAGGVGSTSAARVLTSVPVKELDTANSSLASKGCIAANQFIALPPGLAGRGTDQAVALGAYERISPDGRFVMRSYSGKDLSAVSLIELPAPATVEVAVANRIGATVVAITQTPLANEAFPVQGSWRYVVDTNGEHYTFGDLLKRQKQATPSFQGGMSGFYAAAAEVGSAYPARTSQPIQIRSLSWPNASGDSETTGEGMLTSRTIVVDPVQNRLLGDSGRVNLCLERAGVDGTLYSLPMISVDGQQYSALPQRPVDRVATMRIFGFGGDGKQCLPEQQFASPSGKVTFGFSPQRIAGESVNSGMGTAKQYYADLVYEYRGQAWWYASQLATALNLAPVEDRPAASSEPYRQKIIASAFPGLTRDGRVVYAATWQLCRDQTCADEAGYIVSDPYQSNAYRQHLLASERSGSALTAQGCIATKNVLKERADFAAFHNIPLR